MDILVVAPEVAPYIGSTGLAEVASALPKALRGLGHRVTVAAPLFRGVDPAARSFARRLTKLEARLEGRTYACELYDGRTPGGVEVSFIGHEEVLRGAAALESPGDAQEGVALRAGVFAGAIVELVRARGADVIHAHDWLGALVAHQLAAREVAVPVVLTVHDPSAQGRFDASLAGALGLDDDRGEAARRDGSIGVLAAGLRSASRVTTVSPTFAREITRAPHGAGLEDVFEALGERLSGILNGVDVSVWNPATDAELAARFDPMDLSGKARCKADLQRKFGLPVRRDTPLLGMVASETDEGGFDLFAKAATQVLRNDCQVAVGWVGSEDAELAGVLRELSERWPDRLQVLADTRPSVRHRLISGSDLVLVPSRRQPCGDTQMQAHRYGALPIARRTGGLADTIVDADPKLHTGTGFLFDRAEPEDLLAAVRRAFAAYDREDAVDAMRRRVMTIDHSWERGARLYERAYRDASAA